MTTPSPTPAWTLLRTLTIAGMPLVAFVVGAAGVEAVAAPPVPTVPTVTSPPTTSTITTLPMLTASPAGPAEATEIAGTLVAVTVAPPATLPTLELVDAPDVVDVVTGPTGSLPTAVMVVAPSISVGSLGHFARVTMHPGSNGTGGRLTAATVDFGDGETWTATPRQRALLNIGISVSVVHEYEATLTPQAQHVTATFTDASNAIETAVQDFDTRAYFLLRFGPLHVRALTNCDLFGKGDFELTWDNGPGERTESFKLGKGDIHTVYPFATQSIGVFYNEDVTFEIEIRENDPAGASIWRAVNGFVNSLDGFEFDGDTNPPGLPRPTGPVRELGDHSYTITGEHTLDGSDDCRVQFQFGLSLDMVDTSNVAMAILDRSG